MVNTINHSIKENLPNPAQSIQLNKNCYQNRRLFIEPGQLNKIRKNKNDPFQKLMLDNLFSRIERRMSHATYNLDNQQSLVRGSYTGFNDLALGFLITKEEKYLKKSLKIISTILNNAHKTSDDPLNGGHLLYSLSIYYNWMNEHLSKSQKNKFIKIISDYGSSLYSKTKTPMGYWAGTPLHNISQCAWASIGLAGFSFYFDIPDAKYWLSDAYHNFNLVSWLQAEDGSMIEGPSYSAYGAEMRALFYRPCLQFLNQDLYRKNHLGIGDWFMHLHKPSGDADDHIFPWSDSSKGLQFHSPVGLILSMAGHHKSEHLQSIAHWVLSKGFTNNSGIEWMDILLYDPSVKLNLKKKFKTFAYFDDLENISTRNSWQEKATAIQFKCGPFQGKKAQELFLGDPGCSHLHPDTGSLQLHSRKHELLIDPAYSAIKRTDHHNTATINGYGQLGEGTKWFKVNHALHYEHTASISHVKDTKKWSTWTGELSGVYWTEAKLDFYVRTVVYLKPDILVVMDELKSAKKSKFKIHWTTPSGANKINNKKTIFQNDDVCMRMDYLPLDRIKTEVSVTQRLYKDIRNPMRYSHCCLSNLIKSKTFKAITVISLSDKINKNFSIQNNFPQIDINDGVNKYRIQFPSNEKASVQIKI
ncbi:MAG: hypothetical protein COA79_23585 [Planctomycetota bacterium]|nr:MAG: hypothetical protein COA79_23585 [Planctomycetota bacterium]